MKMTMEPSVYDLLLSAAQKCNDGVKFTLDGDLSQMATQGEFLRKAGFRVGRVDVYPGLYTEEDYKAALKAIWENRVDGWWNYEEKYVEYGICTSEEFRAYLGVK